MRRPFAGPGGTSPFAPPLHGSPPRPSTAQQPELGVEAAAAGFVTGKRKATEGLGKLFPICHSRMEEIVPKDAPVRLVAFNLGYLPGGDKTVITVPRTTELALQAAIKLSSGGLIGVLVYIGHPGGRDELDVVESFASSVPVDTWATCKLQMLNRSIAPVLILQEMMTILIDTVMGLLGID